MIIPWCSFSTLEKLLMHFATCMWREQRDFLLMLCSTRKPSHSPAISTALDTTPRERNGALHRLDSLSRPQRSSLNSSETARTMLEFVFIFPHRTPYITIEHKLFVLDTFRRTTSTPRNAVLPTSWWTRHAFVDVAHLAHMVVLDVWYFFLCLFKSLYILSFLIPFSIAIFILPFILACIHPSLQLQICTQYSFAI